MRILITVQHLHYGGMEKIATELALGLRARGHEVDVVGIYGLGDFAERLRSGGVAVHGPIARGRYGGRAVATLLRLCRSRRFDIAVAVMAKAMHAPMVTVTACRLAGVPCVRWMHGMPAEGPSRLGRVGQAVMTRWGNTVVALTEGHATALAREWGIPREQLRVVWNGQPPPPERTPERTAQVREALGYAADAFVIGTVAGFRPIKRHIVLVDAFERVLAQLPEARLLLVGDGPTRPEVQARVETLGLERAVTFTGNRPDAIELYAGMDVHVLCSYPAETFPLCVCEAMGAGAVPVATAVGGVPELVNHDETGVLVEPESPDALAEAILGLASDPKRLERLRVTGIAYAQKHFSLDAMVGAFEELFAQETR